MAEETRAIGETGGLSPAEFFGPLALHLLICFKPRDELGSPWVLRTVHILGSPSESLTMNLLTTFKGSMMEGFLPAGWNLEKIDKLAAVADPELTRKQPWW